MAFNKRFTYIATPVLVALGGGFATAGCGEDGLPGVPDLCCDDFEIGADLSGANFGLEGSLDTQFKIFAQAMADLSAVAAGTLGDIEVACANLATDMGASREEIAAAQDQSGSARVDALCTLAAGQIDAYFGASGEFNAHGELAVDFEPPRCSASVSAAASCEADCNVSAGCDCDIEANPPTCEGGSMQVACSGSCEAEAGVSVACEGKCEGSCEGSCKADVGATVECQGKCDGTCTAGGSAGGDGIQADGTCNGECDGTCEMSANAEIECSGSCEGSCSGSCTAEAGASVKCDGSCDAEFEPLKCEGGTLKSSCECDAAADCNANCEASASAKAECHPPAVNVVFTADAGASLDAEANVRLNAAIASIKANLPNLLVAVQARGEAFIGGVEASVNAGGSLVADLGDFSAEAAICVPKILSAGATAVANMKASMEAAVKVTGSLRI